MLKFSVFTLISIFAVTAFANTKVLFSSDKAVVVVQGNASDKDATDLFNALKTQAVDTGGFLEKKVSVSSSTQEPLFAVTCKISKSVPDFGSCTLTIFKSTISVLEPDNKFASLLLGYPDSSAALKEFVLPPPTAEDGKIFLSKDRHLGIYSYPQDHSIHLFYR